MLSLSNRVDVKIPLRAGIGLRAEHFEDVLEQHPNVGWFEAHSENYFGIGDAVLQARGGGKPLEYLERIRQLYPVSLHGVGLSAGTTDSLNLGHLEKLKQLIKRIQPGLVSEHLSWGSVNGQYFNDLLPMPYTEEALEHMVERIDQVQDYLGMQILVENVSSYLEFASSTIPEWEFVSALAQRSGCGVLLDVNNVFVNAMNHGFDASRFISNVPVGSVMEIHLAGHTIKEIDGGVIRLDTHDHLVCDEVWDLYRLAVKRFGHVPALIEWDRNLPELDVLLGEARRADRIRKSVDGENVMVEGHERIA
ncbi:MNIO family bufferin maturase [Kaarinaea lacus]